MMNTRYKKEESDIFWCDICVFIKKAVGIKSSNERHQIKESNLSLQESSILCNHILLDFHTTSVQKNWAFSCKMHSVAIFNQLT